MSKHITQADFKGLGQVATHCDLEKLEIALNEAYNFDLCEVFGNFSASVGLVVDEVLSHGGAGHDHHDEANPDWDLAVLGTAFEVNGVTINTLGLKTAIVYYAYARYLVLNGYNDTPNGQVSKENPFSIPKPFKEVQQFADKYRNMAKSVAETAKLFICENKDSFPSLAKMPCPTSLCGDIDGLCNSNTTGYGIRGKNVSKYE